MNSYNTSSQEGSELYMFYKQLLRLIRNDKILCLGDEQVTGLEKGELNDQ